MCSVAKLIAATVVTAFVTFAPCVASTALQQTNSQEPAANSQSPPAATGTVSWPVFNGYRRYHGICHSCHGPDGLGSSFAPDLTNSLKTLDHDKFADVVVNGRSPPDAAAERRMPAFGTDPNVMCYLEDIYAYLKARSDGTVGRGRPQAHAEKPAEAREAEAACMGN